MAFHPAGEDKAVLLWLNDPAEFTLNAFLPLSVAVRRRLL